MLFYNKLELFKMIFKVLWTISQTALMGVFFYYITISVFGWFKKKETPAKDYPAVHKFALLVAAHNEETVVANIVKNLNSLNYPRELFDVFVIADNCDDNTAAIARRNGAIVYERFDNVKKGKGYSLEWMFEKIYNMDKKYDAVCVFDADNLASNNFLIEMNKHLSMGHKVIQGYLDSKNPGDTWISCNNSLAFWIGNRMYQLPRYYLGLSNVLGGTGLVIATDVLKDIGWGATCLTEDLEFSLKIVLKGMKVYWAHDAVIYDEKPLTMYQSWRQRVRWMQGQCDCIVRFFKPLVVKGIKEKDIVALDISLYLVQPIIAVANFIMMVCGLIAMAYMAKPDYASMGVPVDMLSHYYGGYYSTSVITLPSAMLAIALLYINIIFVIMEGKLTKKTLFYFLTYPIYNISWVPIIIQGFMNRNKREWVHTLHTRVMDLEEVESFEKAV